MSYHDFCCLVNSCLYKAVEFVKDDLLPDKKLDEPSYTAAIVTKFPDLMNRKWPWIKFGGCFIHKSPIVHFGKGRNCELGDLLVLCKKTMDSKLRYNAALFQLKTAKNSEKVKIGNKSKQLLLYTHWPQFSFNASDSNKYDIFPKAVTPGAQYMFINKEPLYCHSLCYCRCQRPIIFTDNIPSHIMENRADSSFSRFLWDLIHWQTGRPISDESEKDNDEWSRLIWDLIDRTRYKVFNLQNIQIQNRLQSNGDFFSFMTMQNVQPALHLLYNNWVIGINGVKKDFHDDKKRKGILENTAYKEGISILFIDLDQINKFD